jgi:tight adherence protein B
VISEMPLQFLGIALLLIVAVLLFLVVRSNKKRSPEDIMDRMGRYATREELLAVVDSSGRHIPSAVATSLEQMMEGRSIIERTSNALTRADLRLTVGEFLVFRVLGAVTGFALGFLGIAIVAPAFGILLGIALAVLGFQVPAIYIAIRGNMRRKKFINQLGDTITLMANSLRAGYSLLQTMELVSRETKDPISTEFSRVVREVGLGISTEEAMQNMLRRVPSEDLDLLVTAINIQHEVGGNLAQILSTIGHTIRERVRIQGEVKVLTAQVQLSGYIITAMPIGMGIFIMLANPNYMKELFVWPWICMPIAATVMVILGFFAMRKIANIEV